MINTAHSNTQFKTLGALLAVAGLVLLILRTLGFIGAGEQVPPGNTRVVNTTLPAEAEILRVSKQFANGSQSWPGVVQSRTLTKVAPKMTARIISVAVHNGDRVKKGTLIAQLDERQLRVSLAEATAALTAAKATAAQAQRDAVRSQTLFTHEATTRADYESAQARAQITQAAVVQAANNVEQIRVTLADTTLNAPFDGIIAERLKEPGDMGMPGDPVVTILKPDDLRVEAAIPSECAKSVQLGLSVNVKIEALNSTLQAKVDEIVPQVDRQTGTQLLKAALPFTIGLQPGQFAWLALTCSIQQTVLLIPQTAVLRYGQLEAVKVIADDRSVYTRHIRTGKQHGSLLEVLSGLREGETIMLQPTTEVR